MIITKASLDWQRYGKCVGAPSEWFFPERLDKQTDSEKSIHVAKCISSAKALCAQCPVKSECLDFALKTMDLGNYGVWGGTTPGQREAIREAFRQERIDQYRKETA
jgi:WhiB family redox-sensing transcriptional regulator